MIYVDFHSNIDQILLYTCRVTRTAYMNGTKIVIYAPSLEVTKLDDLLWTFSPNFIPHCVNTSHLCQDTPVILTNELKIGSWFDVISHQYALINLNAKAPSAFADFERIVEIIGNNEIALTAGRSKYRYYQKNKCQIRHFKYSKPCSITLDQND